MNVHITWTNNLGGTAALAQQKVIKIARKMNFKEMGFYSFPHELDNDNELSHRMDGIIAGLRDGDTVIFQYPSWIGYRYDSFFVNKVKAYPKVKLVIFVHDVVPFMFNRYDLIQNEIHILNKADLLILPSEKIHGRLKTCGLEDKDVIYQEIWDYPTDSEFSNHNTLRQIIFTGDYSRFPFLKDYHGKTPIINYSDEKPGREDDTIIWNGYREPDSLLAEQAKGGFGLVWSTEEYFERYYSLNHPYKLGFFLTSGIPVILRKGSVDQEFVEKYGLGFAVDSLEEADTLIQSLTEEEYRFLYNNVRRIQIMFKEGYFTRELLNKAVKQVCEKNCSENAIRIIQSKYLHKNEQKSRSKDLVSVIIPCYNAEKWIDSCLLNLEKQTYGIENLEIIFVDDCSKDSTFDKIQAVYKQYPDIIKFTKTKTNSMCGGARNAGMDLATGKYLMFMDADDELSPRLIDRLHEKIAEYNCDMVHCDHRKFSTCTAPEGKVTGNDYFYDTNEPSQRKKLIIKSINCMVWARLFKREFLEKNNIRFLEGTPYEDVHFTGLVVLLLKSSYWIGEQLYYYRQNPDSILHSTYSVEKERKITEVGKTLIRELKERGIYNDVMQNYGFEIEGYLIWKTYFDSLVRLTMHNDNEKDYYCDEIKKLVSNVKENPYTKITKNPEYLRFMDWLK